MSGVVSSQAVFVFRPRRVALWLTGIAVGIVGIGVVLNVAKVVFGDSRFEWLVDLFRLNGEENIPSFFSGVLFLVSTTLLAVVWRVNPAVVRRPVAWPVLAAVFGFLGYDELFGVHERMIDPLRERFELSGAFSFAWILVYGVLVVAVGAMFWAPWRRMEPRLKRWFAASAVVYVAGAIGFEMVGGSVYTGTEGDIVYGLVYTIEESLEMAGLIMFIFALLSLLAGHWPQVSLTIVPDEHIHRPDRADHLGPNL